LWILVDTHKENIDLVELSLQALHGFLEPSAAGMRQSSAQGWVYSVFRKTMQGLSFW
jgi:hypothetical protein